MRVYKFLSAQWAKEAIVKRRLKISLLHGLNDPWDGHAVSFQSEAERNAWQRAIATLSQTKGLICTSRNWSDPVLWSHYADQHKGVALGFDVMAEALPVTYQRELIKFPKEFLTQLTADKMDLTLRALSTKFTNWKYEDEVRFFTKLDEPDLLSGHFFMKFGIHLELKEVIFGARYSNPADETLILSIIRKFPNVDCVKARLGNKTFNVEKDETWTFAK
ncbi:MAG: hypothetical protein RLZZ437_98 [Pseudomonadota bacterium]